MVASHQIHIQLLLANPHLLDQVRLSDLRPHNPMLPGPRLHPDKNTYQRSLRRQRQVMCTMSFIVTFLMKQGQEWGKGSLWAERRKGADSLPFLQAGDRGALGISGIPLDASTVLGEKVGHHLILKRVTSIRGGADM